MATLVEEIKEEETEPVKLTLEDYPLRVACDMEAPGPHPVKHPTLSIGFVVMTQRLKVIYEKAFYAPCKIGDEPGDLFNASTWEWFHEPKQKKAFEALQKGCAASPYATHKDMWQAVAQELDVIYERFDTKEHPLLWIADCADYDYGRLNQYISQEGIDRNDFRFDKHGNRHFMEDMSSGKEAMKRLYPDAHRTLKKEIEALPFKHTHDCLDDAKSILAKYITYEHVLKDHGYQYV